MHLFIPTVNGASSPNPFYSDVWPLWAPLPKQFGVHFDTIYMFLIGSPQGGRNGFLNFKITEHI